MEKIKKKTTKKIGNSFHDKVEKIFSNGGFNIDYSDYNKPGADIIVSFGRSRIIIQCKKSEAKGRISMQDLIDSYATKVIKSKADAAIIATSGIRMPNNYLCFHEKEKVAVWDDNNVDYYKDLVNKIKKFAAYQILSDLSIYKKFDDVDLSVSVLRIKQGGKDFYLTKIPVTWVIKASYVLRRTRTGDTKSYQRLLNASRIKNEIPDHLNDGGLFPNSIILVSRESLDYKKSKIKINSKIGSLWIMDGQHRVYSFANVTNEKIINDFELPCVIFDGNTTPKHEQAEIFVDINQNAKPVSAALTLELQDSFGLPVAAGVKLVKNLQKLSFIKNRIRMYAEKSDGEKNNTISFVTFATNHATASILDQIKISKAKTKEEEEDLKIKKTTEAFSRFYKAFYKNFREEWENPKKFVFSTDKGVRALAHLLQIIMKSNAYKIPSEKAFQKIFIAMRKGQPTMSIEETRRSFAGEAGALDLAKKWAKGVQSGGIADFAVEILGTVSAKVIQEKKIRSGETIQAKEILKEWFSAFKGKAYGMFNYGDITTIKLLDSFLSREVNEVRLIIDIIRGDEEKIIEEIKKIKEKRNLAIKIISHYYEKDTTGEGKKFPTTHGRWISDGKFKINNEMDLNSEAMASRDHTKAFLRLEKDDNIEEFEKEWTSLLNHRDIKIKLYE